MLSALQGSIGPMSLSAAAQGRPCWPSGADQTPEPSVQQPVLGTNPPDVVQGGCQPRSCHTSTPRDGLLAEVRAQNSRENPGACGTACYQRSRAAVCEPLGAFELKTWDLWASMGRDWCPLVLQGGLAPRINS